MSDDSKERLRKLYELYVNAYIDQKIALNQASRPKYGVLAVLIAETEKRRMEYLEERKQSDNGVGLPKIRSIPILKGG